MEIKSTNIYSFRLFNGDAVHIIALEMILLPLSSLSGTSRLRGKAFINTFPAVPLLRSWLSQLHTREMELPESVSGGKHE